MSNLSKCVNARILSTTTPKVETAIVKPTANFLGGMGKYSGLHPFRAWVQKVLPQVYDDSLSYQELVYKLMHHINTLIDDVTTCEENIEILKQAYLTLQDYVNNYFDNLDIEGEIEIVLDNMINDGSLFSKVGDCIVLGTGLQSDVIEEERVTTEEQVATIEDYPECCAGCQYCSTCTYANLEDGAKIVSTYTGTDVTIVTTIVRDGDEITTTVVTTDTVRKYNIYSDVKAGTGIKISPSSSGKAGTQVYSTDDSHIEDVARNLITGSDSAIDNYIEQLIEGYLTSGDADEFEAYVKKITEEYFSGGSATSFNNYVKNMVEAYLASGDANTFEQFVNNLVEQYLTSGSADTFIDYVNSLINKYVTDGNVDDYINSMVNKYVVDGSLDDYIGGVAEDAVSESDIMTYVYNNLTVRTGVQKSKSGNTINIGSRLTAGNLISISPASSLSSTGAQTIAVNSDALLELIQGWIDDGTLDLPESDSDSGGSSGDSATAYDGTTINSNYITAYNSSAFPSTGIYMPADTDFDYDYTYSDWFTINNSEGYSTVTITVGVDVTMYYGTALFYINGNQVFDIWEYHNFNEYDENYSSPYYTGTHTFTVDISGESSSTISCEIKGNNASSNDVYNATFDVTVTSVVLS